MGDHNEAYTRLYASHKSIVDLVNLTHGADNEQSQEPQRFSVAHIAEVPPSRSPCPPPSPWLSVLSVAPPVVALGVETRESDSVDARDERLDLRNSPPVDLEVAAEWLDGQRGRELSSVGSSSRSHSKPPGAWAKMGGRGGRGGSVGKGSHRGVCVRVGGPVDGGSNRARRCVKGGLRKGSKEGARAEEGTRACVNGE